MSYTNYINKLSTQTKKAIEDTFTLNEELQKYKNFFNLFPKYNSNSIGYKVKFIFQIDNELNDHIHQSALQAILSYIIEMFIQNSEMTYFQYNFYLVNEHLCLSLFNKNRDYLENISKNLIDFINFEMDNICLKIRSKILDVPLPLKTKIKIIHKEFPILIDIICNQIKEKKLLNKTEEFINATIKILQLNDINILKDSEIKLETLRSEEDPVKFLIEKSNNDEIIQKNKKLKIEEKTEKTPEKTYSIFNEMETVNDNIKQLFWHTLDTKKSFNYTDLKHSIVFILILALLIYTVPNLAQKFMDFSKSNSVIDNILDLATEDLTTTITKTQSNIPNFNKSFNKLETIQEGYFEQSEPFQPFEPSDDIGLITRNIIKKFNESENTNEDLKSIENRLRHILEETDTKT